jgi:dephospho-CoA kinase
MLGRRALPGGRLARLGAPRQFQHGLLMALLRVALTGGIATGKSYVRARVAGHGIPTLDADTLARDAVAPGSSGLAEAVARFGERILAPDGGLDRKALAATVFADPQARADLEAIVHPRVREATGTWLDRLAVAGESLAIVDIPLLFEAGRDRDFDRVIVTSCPRSQQVARVVERDGLTPSQADARIDAQLPTDEKVRRADFVIDTGGTYGDTNRQIDRVVEKLLELAAAAGR